MTKLYLAAKKFVCQEEGATMVEYGIMVALIAIVCIGVITTLGLDVKAVFQNVSTKIAPVKDAG